MKTQHKCEIFISAQVPGWAIFLGVLYSHPWNGSCNKYNQGIILLSKIANHFIVQTTFQGKCQYMWPLWQLQKAHSKFGRSWMLVLVDLITPRWSRSLGILYGTWENYGSCLYDSLLVSQDMHLHTISKWGWQRNWKGCQKEMKRMFCWRYFWRWVPYFSTTIALYMYNYGAMGVCAHLQYVFWALPPVRACICSITHVFMWVPSMGWGLQGLRMLMLCNTPNKYIVP